MNKLQPLLIALQFLTTLPVKVTVPIANKQLGQSLLFYPIVGFIIAVILISLASLLTSQSSYVAAILVLVSWVILTGGLHLDGLADSADAWLGGLGDKVKTLKIMKDPTSGPIAVSILVLLLLTKFIMLAELIAVQNWIAIILATTLSRTALPLLFLTTPYVRQNGIAALLIQHQPKTTTKQMVLAVTLISIFLSGVWILLLSFGLFLLLRYWMLQRLDGVTGDTAGAMVELLETGILITAVII
ncbi:MAG: adenosylcobinamide-GDP ribazoletransferase [Gammaproteobacteria bacterium]|nr:MAG: adenosylcobinamide-GDP ribazoletransferase [Gammaproteobacteria bacterium]